MRLLEDFCNEYIKGMAMGNVRGESKRVLEKSFRRIILSGQSLEDARKRRFLDLGCGIGRHSIFFGKNGFNVRCLDISEEAVVSTKQWAEQEGLHFDYAIGDMLKLPYET